MTRRGNRATRPPYTGCSSSMTRKVAVNSSCSVKAPTSKPWRSPSAIMPRGNTAAMSVDAPIASRTGRST